MIYCHCCRKPFQDVESAEFIPLPEIGVYAVQCKNCLRRDIEEYEEEDYESDLKKELLARTELKPCPFCGSTAKIREEMDGRAETYSIHCRGCDMHYTKFVWRARDKRGVIKEWNRRADQ